MAQCHTVRQSWPTVVYVILVSVYLQYGFKPASSLAPIHSRFPSSIHWCPVFLRCACIGNLSNNEHVPLCDATIWNIITTTTKVTSLIGNHSLNQPEDNTPMVTAFLNTVKGVQNDEAMTLASQKPVSQLHNTDFVLISTPATKKNPRKDKPPKLYPIQTNEPQVEVNELDSSLEIINLGASEDNAEHSTVLCQWRKCPCPRVQKKSKIFSTIQSRKWNWSIN
jgi:hypothetical protein